ncbi:hypothetical protein C8J56DRAFT_753333, partial [Mycena floridula]
YLKLVAVLDWVEKYQPMLSGIVKAPEKMEVTQTVGTFAFENKVAQGFFNVGLPFWQVHNLNKLAHIQINSLHDVLYPS